MTDKEEKNDPVRNLLVLATDCTIETLEAKLTLSLDNGWRSTDTDQYRFFQVLKLRPIQVSEYFTRPRHHASTSRTLTCLACARIQTLLPASLPVSNLRGFRFESGIDSSGKLYVIPLLWYLPPVTGAPLTEAGR
jgi:hypothetical protein